MNWIFWSTARNRRGKCCRSGLLALLVASSMHSGQPLHAAESLWIEAEHLSGVSGYYFPAAANQKSKGSWALSGPGVAAEWTQGGESGFLSIAVSPGDTATATKAIELPETGRYAIWVRYGDRREKAEPFQVQIDQPGQPVFTANFGEQPLIEEDNEMKLYWNWAFAWDHRNADLNKGPAMLTLRALPGSHGPRQVDCLVLTTDADYRPRIKEQPRNPAWELLDGYRQGLPTDLEPLAKRRGDFALPESWKLKTFKDRGFLYLWNVGLPEPIDSWLSDKPDRIRVPYRIGDADVLKEFEKLHAGKSDGIPIFSDPRIVPLFHGIGPVVFATDAESGAVTDLGQRFAKWLAENPRRQWGGMMNYAGPKPIGPKGQELFAQFRDRYVGSIAGESLGYFSVDAVQMKQATANASTRRQLVEAFTPWTLAANAQKYQSVYGKQLDANPYEDVISCLSVGNVCFAPLLADWGSRTLGYESTATPSSVLGMRWAFLRGLARQRGKLTATYRSCNFGDAATIFTGDTHWYTKPANIVDNFYSVYSGAGMTWYKFDIWYQFMAGASMFYHEQGFDEFWMPGGTSFGRQPLELSPKGKLVDRFLRTTAADFDRGQPFTPIAFLVDYAHGWEPATYWPNSFKNWHQNEQRFLYGDHEQMLQQYFWTAFHPIGREAEKPITGTNEVYLPGVYGDMFDCVAAYPDVSKWTTIDSYPVVIAAGEIELSAAEGRRLAQYVSNGGTLLVADVHLSGPGVAELNLPAAGPMKEAVAYRFECGEPIAAVSPRFRYRPLTPGAMDRPLATTSEGDVFCLASDRGQGRLISLSVPHGLCIGKQVHPMLPRLIAHLSRGLMPIEVDGDVNWLLNKSSQGWMLTLLNPAGQAKPQQGITPTDYRENRRVLIRAKVPLATARDRLLPNEPLTVRDNTVELEVPAGAVKVIELR